MEEEEVKKEESKKDKKRIGFKILLGIVIVIVALVILFLINFIRNLVILNDLIAKELSFKNSTNYSYTSVYYDTSDEDNKVIIEIYYKDGKSKMILDSGKDKIIVWYDEKTKENIFLNEATKQASVTSSEDMLGDELLYFYDEDNKIYYAMTSFITNSEIDGQKSYKIVNSNDVSYINKEDGTVLKNVYKGAIVNDEKCDSVTEYKNWKFNELTEEEMERPNLAEYTVVNN